MGIIPTNIGASIAGVNNAPSAARPAAKTDAPRAGVRRPHPDELLLDTTGVEGPEAVRGQKGSDQEESREDSQRRRHYTPTQPGEDRPRLDVAG